MAHAPLSASTSIRAATRLSLMARKTVPFLCRWGIITGLDRELAYVNSVPTKIIIMIVANTPPVTLFLSLMIATGGVLLMLVGPTSTSDVDSVTCKISIACLQRDRSRRVFVPTGIFIIIFQAISDFDNRK